MLEKILALCEKHGFLVKQPLVQKYLIAPVGTLLLENLKTEWLCSMVNNKDYTIFYAADQNIRDGYNFARKQCNKMLPFGLAFIENNKQLGNKYDGNGATLELNIERGNNMNAAVYIPSVDSIHSFHQWQRQRRMWWRRFSASPGRYFTTDMLEEVDGSQEIRICAKYAWGNVLVEVLKLSREHPLLSKDKLENVFNGKNVDSMVLQSTLNIGTMYLNTICDAFEVLKLEDAEERYFLKLHRKLAPYKIAYAILNPHNSRSLADLEDLSRYLCRKMRHANVTSLLHSSFACTALESQFKHFDHLGIPYTVVLNGNTLKNGVLQLRSRDTTIKEEVHVSQLPNYVNVLLKNY